MILLIDTSTEWCRIDWIEDDGRRTSTGWRAGRQLAKGLLGTLAEQLAHKGKTWNDLTGIGVFTGPGSFTGLRIGLTVMNTLADGLNIPIVGARGDHWQEEALRRLVHDGENDLIALPYYGAEANITTPRK
jgi:tRNA threonylcarbamoyladenosine biosynthesis protein TsaB